MNEKLFDFALGAYNEAAKIADSDTAACYELKIWKNIFRNKFAEIIIRECARVDSEANNPDHIDGNNYNQTILQHFGIKE